MNVSSLLRMEQIEKRFGGIRALRGIDLEIYEGEVHAIVGENGAGKSTLMKILAREIEQDSGNIFLQGELLNPLSPWETQSRGLVVVHQDLNLIPSLTVAQNILLGCPPTHRLGFLQWKRGYAGAEAALGLLGSSVRIGQPVSALSAAERQLVILARALVNKPRLLILDEPTARLGIEESEFLFTLISELKRNKVTIIYISHRLEEIYRVCDRISILRDGKKVTTMKTRELSQDDMVNYMIGRKLANYIPKHQGTLGNEVLAAKNLKFGAKVKGVSFSVHQGEVLGLVGAVGAGQSEVLDLLFGAVAQDEGQILIEGKKSAIRKPAHAIKEGIALVPEDRTTQGLVPDFSVRENLTIVASKRMSFFGLIAKAKEDLAAREAIKQVQINPPNPGNNVKSLSGGNQQKVVLGKWLINRQKIYLLNEATSGIDVGAKVEIYKIIAGLAESGAAMIIATSDIDEALGLCDRIMVMLKGRIVAELSPGKTSRENVLTYVMGGGQH